MQKALEYFSKSQRDSYKMGSTLPASIICVRSVRPSRKSSVFFQRNNNSNNKQQEQDSAVIIVASTELQRKGEVKEEEEEEENKKKEKKKERRGEKGCDESIFLRLANDNPTSRLPPPKLREVKHSKENSWREGWRISHWGGRDFEEDREEDGTVATPRQAGRQASKQTSKQASKQARKRASKRPSKQASKQANKQAGTRLSYLVVKLMTMETPSLPFDVVLDKDIDVTSGRETFFHKYFFVLTQCRIVVIIFVCTIFYLSNSSEMQSHELLSNLSMSFPHDKNISVKQGEYFEKRFILTDRVED
ncbi:hypothetical protein V1477_012450 [Vespula maculifrons]|uniref:Uncharacterized protein n=1 Tax=Vespula maculifrons TaxID=7453 RepID=A0ABD2BXL8_VESMC